MFLFYSYRQDGARYGQYKLKESDCKIIDRLIRQLLYKVQIYSNIKLKHQAFGFLPCIRHFFYDLFTTQPLRAVGILISPHGVKMGGCSLGS